MTTEIAATERAALDSSAWLGRSSWIEVDNDAVFEWKEGMMFKTTLLFKRCTQLKKRVKRETDVVEFTGATRDECDQQVARFCERDDVRLMFSAP